LRRAVRVSAWQVNCATVISGVVEGLERGDQVQLSLYGVSKAFDCVDHTLLLDKLAKIGFGSTCLRFFESISVC